MRYNGRRQSGMDADKICHFRDLALLELKRAERYRNFLSLLVLNLSEFLSTAGRRKINSLEETGQFMDAIVKRVKQAARETDFVSNMDNARLVMLLPETDHNGAQVAGERFQELVSEFLAEFLQSNYDFSIPLEISCFPDSAGQKSFKNRLMNLKTVD